MECMGANALKSSFSSEMNMNSQGIMMDDDDIWCLNGGDDFSVDEFFDLPNEEEEEEIILEEEDEDEELELDSSNSSSSASQSSCVHPVVDSARFDTHLGFPDNDMEELELWSHLMDDSIPQPTLACPKSIMEDYNKKTGFNHLNRVEPVQKHHVVGVGGVRVSIFPLEVPVKPRSKRSRTIVNRTWFIGSPPKTESSSSSSPSSPVSTLLFPPPVYQFGRCWAPPVKKVKRKPALSVDSETGFISSVQRRCTHCQVTKTPQWRAGPNGPKTLCNACGVRFKSGRLFPEYRPACSPTFSSEVHSNSHRKVLEMRRKKEGPESFTGSVQLISSS